MIFFVSSPCPSYYSSFGSCLYWLPCPPLSENTPNQLSAALQRSPSTTGRKTATSLSTEIALGSLVLYTRSIYLLAPSAVYGSNLCVWSQHVLQRIPYPSHVTHLSICTEIHLQFSSENDVNRIFQISSTESIQRIDSVLKGFVANSFLHIQEISYCTGGMCSAKLIFPHMKKVSSSRYHRWCKPEVRRYEMVLCEGKCNNLTQWSWAFCCMWYWHCTLLAVI